MLNFDWNDLSLTNRMYICLLAGLHESYAYLPYEEFATLPVLRLTDFAARLGSAGAHWSAATGGYWIPDTVVNSRTRLHTSLRWGDDADFKIRETAKRKKTVPRKFRQLVNGKWHYWGIIDELFKAPVSSEVPSQQFTGLYSKSGKEIYDCDIGKLVLDRIIPIYVICVMEWRSELASFCWITKQAINIRNPTKEWKIQDSHRFEIIGNTCETPELILR